MSSYETSTDLSNYNDLSRFPVNTNDGNENNETSKSYNNSGFSPSGFTPLSPSGTATLQTSGFGNNQNQNNPSNPNDRLPLLSPESYSEAHPELETEFSTNVSTLIRLVNELPDGVTKPTGAQIIRLTMEAMGISMEDVLSDAQTAQSEMLDAVRANIKKIEEYKTVIRKLETDIKFYQGRANELSEIIDLFILSNTSSNNNNNSQNSGNSYNRSSGLNASAGFSSSSMAGA